MDLIYLNRVEHDHVGQCFIVQSEVMELWTGTDFKELILDIYRPSWLPQSIIEAFSMNS